MRNGVFPSGVIIFDPTTGQPFPNNTIPQSRYNSISTKILNMVLPAPNLPGVAQVNKSGFSLDPTLNYYYVPKHWQSIDQYNGRIDYNLSARDSFFARYTNSPNQIIGDGPLATNIQNSIVGFERDQLGGQNLVTAWDHTFGPTSINEARFGFDTDPQEYEKGDNSDWAATLGISQFLVPNAVHGLPYIVIGGVSLSSGRYRPLHLGERNFEATDNLTLIRGAHTLIIGGNIRRSVLPTSGDEESTGEFTFNGAQTRNRNFPTTGTTYCPGETTSSTACNAGDATADFLLGDLAHFEEGSPLTPYTDYFSNWAAYVNDAWRVHRNLTLTLGLRYEYQTREHGSPPVIANPDIANGEFQGKVGVAEVAGQISPAAIPQALSTVPGAYVGCSTIGLPAQTCVFSDKRDWGPRAGLAWQINSNTVVRAGAGIFYGSINGDDATSELQNPPFTLTIATPTFTAPPAGLAPPPLSLSNPLGSTSVPVPSLVGIIPHYRMPSTYQSNLTVERRLAAGMVLSVGYVAVLGRHLDGYDEDCCYYNVPQPVGIVLAPGQKQVQADSSFAPIQVEEFKNTSSYNALQVHLGRQWSHGFSLSASYTYSHDIGVLNGLSDPLDASLDRGSLNYDLRQNLVISPIWQLPFGESQRWVNKSGPLNQLVGGWRFATILSERTGFPFTPTLSGTNLLNDSYRGADRPDRACNGTLPNPTVFNWYEKSCFTVPTEPTTPGAALVDGNSGPNILYGPGAFGMDMNLSKTFPITERVALDFRVEAFNVFNHPTFGQPPTGISTSPAANTTPAEISTTTSLPRIVQFALKLHF